MSSTHKFEVGQIYLLNEDWGFYRGGDLVEVVIVDDERAGVGNSCAITKNHIKNGRAVLAASAPDADGWREWYRVADKCPVEHGTMIDVQYTDGVYSTNEAGIGANYWGEDSTTRGVAKYRPAMGEVFDDVYGGALMEPKKRDNKYRRKIVDRQTGEYIYADVYDIIEAFSITCSALAHAIKKLLCSGTRHAKSQEQDKKEAIWSVEESLKLDENSR